MKIVQWLKTFISKLFPGTFADTDVQGMEKNIELWMNLFYDNPPWNKECHGQTLDLASTVAAEFARLITIEMKTEITGSPRADFLNLQYKRVTKVLRRQLELACATGGVVIKPYVSGGQILPDFNFQGDFYPISYGNDRMDGVVFYEQCVHEKHIYTRLEKHLYYNGVHTIESKAFLTRGQNPFAKEVELADVPCWGNLDPLATISGVDRPLFGYFKVPLANHIDKKNPLGVSVFSRAVKQLKQADEQWDRLLWEFEGGALAVDAAADMLDIKNNPQTQKPEYKLPKSSERLFRRLEAISGNAMGESFYRVFNPTLRDDSYLSGLDAILRKIEYKTHLAYGTISNPQNVDKTAEEVKSSKQRSYATICDMQDAVQSALEDYIYAIDAMATACHLAPAGKIETQYTWGDGVMEDRDKEQAIRMQEVSAGLSDKVDYLMWRYGLTEDQAIKKLKENKKRSKDESFFDDEDGEA